MAKSQLQLFRPYSLKPKKEANLVTLMTGPFSHEVHSGAVIPQIVCAPPSFVVPRKFVKTNNKKKYWPPKPGYGHT